jgi:hypothetical protein
VDEHGRQPWYLDADGDGYGREDAVIDTCERPEGRSLLAGDCDDTEPTIHPGADEVCDGVDRDCDGMVDSYLWGQDFDGDGYAGAPTPWSACDGPPPAGPAAGDCDDADPLIFPGAGEVCGDAVDGDCDGMVSCLAVSVVTEAGSCDFVWALVDMGAFDVPCEDCWFDLDFYDIVLQPASRVGDCAPDVWPWYEIGFVGDELNISSYYGEGDVDEDLTSTTGGWAAGIFGFDHTFDSNFDGVVYTERWFGEIKLDEIEYIPTDDGYDGGRPFTVDGAPRLARTAAQGGGWSAVMGADAARPAPPLPPHLQRRVASAWAQLGRMEHASVGSFARFSLELLAMGAPPALLTEAALAMADEVRHARACFGLAEALGGEPTSPAALDVSGALAHLDRNIDRRAILTSLLTEACVIETVAAAQAERALAAAASPVVRGVLAEIVADEARHAAYGWRCAKWMLDAHPELRGVAQEVLAGLAPAEDPLPEADPDAAGLAAFGLLDARTRAQSKRETWEKVIRPAAALLLREGPACA